MLLGFQLVLGITLTAAGPPDGEVSAAPAASSLSPDGSELALAYSDGSLALVDIEDQQVRLRVPPGDSRARCTAWSADGRHLALLDADGTLRIVERRDGSVVGRVATRGVYLARPMMGRSVEFLGDGETILAACGSSPAQLWRWRAAELIADLHLDGGPACARAVSQDGNLVALGNRVGNVGVWDARSGKPVAEPVQVQGRVASLALDPAGRTLAVGGENSKVVFFGIPSLEVEGEIEHDACSCFGKDYDVGSLTYSRDGKYLLTGSCGSWAVCAWELESGKRLWCHDHGGGNPWCAGGRFSPDGSHTTLVREGRVLDSATGRELYTLPPKARNEGGRKPWYSVQGGFAWTVYEGRLVVSRTGDGTTLLDLGIDELAAR